MFAVTLVRKSNKTFQCKKAFAVHFADKGSKALCGMFRVSLSYSWGCCLRLCHCRDVRTVPLMCPSRLSKSWSFPCASAEMHACFGRHTCVLRAECMCTSSDTHVNSGRCTISDVPVCEVKCGFRQLSKPRFLRAGIAVKKLQESAARLLPLQDENRNFAVLIVKRLTTIKHPQYK